MPTELSEKQREFADGDTPAMVIACPGAGKTRAIVARYVRRASASTRKGVALLSFTNAAVDEVGRRCSSQQDLLCHPHFVGTFDSFIQRLIYGPWFATKNLKVARFIESWDVQDVTRVIPDARKPYEFFSLENFDFDERGVATLVPSRISTTYRQNLLSIYNAKKAFCDEKASQIRRSRLERSFVSCSESRRQTLFWLRQDKKRAVIARALAARFSEVIVDEAQDCGTEELELLRALREAGVLVSIVGDPDQAIFEFRNAVPELVVEFGKSLESQIVFSENYRSSPAICKMNSALRLEGKADDARGDLATCETPVFVIAYNTLSDVAPRFREVLIRENLSESGAIVISHSGKDARKAAQASEEAAGVNRFSFIAALTGVILRDKTTGPVIRRRALDRLAKRLMELYTNVNKDSLDVAALELGTSVPELKGIVVRLALSLDARTLTREQYAPALRNKISSLTWPLQPTIGNLGQVVSVCPQPDWAKLALDQNDVGLACGTIHSVKGLEFESVCLVIPKMRTGVEMSGLQAWLEGVGSEARRVLYVGASRAKRLLVVAVHESDRQAVLKKLEELGIKLT